MVAVLTEGSHSDMLIWQSIESHWPCSQRQRMLAWLKCWADRCSGTCCGALL